MFEGRRMMCEQGNQSELICVTEKCSAHSAFVCSRNCSCFNTHNKACSLKNINSLSNEVESLLKRNFHKEFKGDGIQIVSRIARQLVPAPRNSRYCLTYCQANSKHDMEFKVHQFSTCVGVGVMHKPTIMRNKYNFITNSEDIGHGGYMLLSNGYQYSHSMTSQNFKEVEGFDLRKGSTVKLYIVRNQLVIQQNKKSLRLTLPEEEMENLYYGIYLYDAGDEMEVMTKS